MPYTDWVGVSAVKRRIDEWGEYLDSRLKKLEKKLQAKKPRKRRAKR